jgi:uncharacterized membrane protein YfcA
MDTWTLLAVVGLVAGAVSGATGFGFALVATAVWGQYFEPQRVTLFALVYMMGLNVAYLPMFWRQIPWRRLMPFVLGALPGVPLGAWALSVLPVQEARLGIGAVLVVYGAYMLWRRADARLLPWSPRWAWGADVGVGFASGFLGGLASLSGFLPTLWCAWRSQDKLANRGLVQGFILLSGVWALVCVGQVVQPDTATWMEIAWGVPFVAVGGGVGLYLFSRLDHAQFMRLVLGLLVVCGALMVVRAWSALITS